MLNVGHARMEGVLGAQLALEVVFLLKEVISLSLAAAVSLVTQLMVVEGSMYRPVAM